MLIHARTKKYFSQREISYKNLYKFIDYDFVALELSLHMGTAQCERMGGRH